MKKLSTIIAAVCFTFSYAQKVSDYQYVTIAEKFSGFKNNQYKMDVLLSKTLKQKKYTVLAENRSQWPSDANSNPCNVLSANVKNDSGFLKNKIILEFTDCNGKVISSQKASTMIKEFEEGYPDALKKALASVPVSNPQIIETVATVAEIKYAETDPKASAKTVDSKATLESGKYSKGKLSLQKIQIDSERFILVENNSSVPFATFKATTKRDTFKVKLNTGASTIGYYENGNIVIEMPNGNDDYTKEVFILN